MKDNDMSIDHQIAIRKVQWALQEAYKISVHNLGILDWSKENLNRKRQSEIDQIRIARLILRELNIELKKKGFLKKKKE